MKNIDLLNLALLFIAGVDATRPKESATCRAEASAIMQAVEAQATRLGTFDTALAYFKSNPLRVLGRELLLC